jgi:nucleoside-diphosphate-sugar epimerase
VKVLVTGAAGFVGGHLVEMLVARGDEVRALVRRGEDTGRLRLLEGVETVEGDLTDERSLQRAVRGVERVYNVAAKTGPWGLEADYEAVNVAGLAGLIMAAMEAGVRRIVHTSSITVYGHRLDGVRGVTEDHPYRAEDNPYSRTKIAGEKLIWNLVRQRGAPVVVVRPGWVYGPRDEASFGRVVRLVESGGAFIIGRGDNAVPVVYVRDVAQGLIRAGDAGADSVGRAYNIVDDRPITQAAYLNTIADFLEVPHVARRLPRSALYVAGRMAEVAWRAAGRRKGAPPPLTTYGVTLLAGDQRFSAARARRELGYCPEFDVRRGVEAGVRWYLDAGAALPQFPGAGAPKGRRGPT